MVKKIKCQDKTKSAIIRVKVIKAPIVDTNILRQVILSRARALTL
jgi:hypothetical protein